MKRDSIEGLASRLADAIPGSLAAMRAEAEENFRAVLKSSLERLDLVTRDEFEVQEAVLQRTREKLEALEAKVRAMEGESS
jgi:BMFP domain-containing protein YqiC